jgi:tryptophanyl-tRNA synthetase
MASWFLYFGKIEENMKEVSLTGIKPTGTPHLGNYLGAIRPALEMAQKYSAVYFIADYHALTTVHDGARMKKSIYEVAATWIALGLNPQEVIFYKQSDVPEIFELNWLLSCFTPKGFMNRAHAYKDAVAKNEAENLDADSGVNMGLYSYPCLMNADILLFKSNVVPVGKDQKQHVEFARDVAQKFNRQYNTQLFAIPEPVIHQETDVITGLDGRKMSKSYDNTIEIFLSEKQLKKKINQIVTNSQEIDEPKDPDICNVFALYKLFASKPKQAELAAKYRAGGMGWGHAKAELFEVLNSHFAVARTQYEDLLSNTAQIDKILEAGALKARAQASLLLTEARRLVGVA